MGKIVSGLTTRSTGQAVVDLQAGLYFLIKKSDFVNNNDLKAKFESDLKAQTYTIITAQIVSLFQKSRKLTGVQDGSVDEATAKALNLELDNAVKAGEFSWPSGPDTTSGSPGSNPQQPTLSISGHAFFESGAPAITVNLGLYRKKFVVGNTGSDKEAVGDTVATNDIGFYRFEIPVSASSNLSNLAIYALSSDKLTQTAVSDILEIKMETVANIIIPDSVKNTYPAALIPEYTRLRTALLSATGVAEPVGNATLAGLTEDTQRQDFTLLSSQTGWNVRLIVLISKAAYLNQKTKTIIPVEVLYGLLRLALSSDPAELANLSDDTWTQAITNTKSNLIIPNTINLTSDLLKQYKSALLDLLAERKLTEYAPASEVTLKDFLIAANVTDEKQQKKFLSAQEMYSDGSDQFWTSLKTEPNRLTDAQITTLKIQNKLAQLTLNNLPLIKILDARKTDRDNVKVEQVLLQGRFYRPENWVTEIRALVTSNTPLDKLIPPIYKGNAEQNLTSYANEMAQKVRTSFPMQIIKNEAGLAGDQFALGSARNDVVNFIDRAQTLGFKFGDTPVETFLQKHPETLPTADEAAKAAKAAIKKIARCYQLTDREDEVFMLIRTNYDSAYKIVSVSYAVMKKAIEAIYGTLSTTLAARFELIYQKAQDIANTTYRLFSEIKVQKSLPNVAAIPVSASNGTTPAQNAAIKSIPTLEALFGSLDYFDCEHCRSVLSPAAYFVDLLRFLDPQANKSNRKDLYSKLIARRPDLPLLELSCENTETALPYIDVVNEILEYKVATAVITTPADPELTVAKNTDKTTSEALLAEPQNVIRSAYQTLATTAKYPLNLPFDWPIEIARAFANYAGMPLVEILSALRTSDTLYASSADYGYFQIFMESLGLSPAEYNLLTSQNLTTTWYELYGFDSAIEATGADAQTHKVTIRKDGQGQRIDINSAKTLSRRLGVSYMELAQIVSTRFVNPEKSLTSENRLVLFDTTASSSFENAELRYYRADEKQRLPTETATNFATFMVFFRINIFVRLWRKLNWTIKELDLALQVLWVGNNTQAVTSDSSDYMKTFLIRLSHLKWLDQQLTLGNDSRQKILSLWAPITLEGYNGDSLYNQIFKTRPVLRGDPIFGTLDSASQFAEALNDHLPALQSGLGLSNDEIMLILDDVEEINTTTLPKNIKDMITIPGNIKVAALSINNISILYRYKTLSKGLGLSISDVIRLKKISGLNPFTPLDIRVILSQIEIDSIFNQTIRFIEVANKLKDHGIAIEDVDYWLAHHFDPVGKYRTENADFKLLVEDMKNGFERIEKEYANKKEILNKDAEISSAIANHLFETLAKHFGVDNDLIIAMSMSGGSPVEVLLTDMQNRDTSYLDENDPYFYSLMLILKKFIQITTQFGFSLREIDPPRQLSYSVFEYNKFLSTEKDNIIPGALASFLSLLDYVELRKEIAGDTDDIVKVFSAPIVSSPGPTPTPSLDIAYVQISNLARCNIMLIQNIAASLGYVGKNLPTLQSIRKLWGVLKVAQRFSVSADVIKKWKNLVLGMDFNIRFNAASSIKQAIKATYEVEQWQQIASQIFDKIRQQQRDALVAFIKHKQGFNSKEELYAYFLIDPGMEPVVQTSRIRLAIASVQAFIQRCLLNLEVDISPDDINQNEWEWMKRYRVWEANRKIFLYPENWLEPEFRDDKTDLYMAFESRLLEDDVSNDLVEEGLLTYLKGLEKIARLEILATHYESANEKIDAKLHVVARTYSMPYQYYYRFYQHGEWSAWEVITTQMSGKHVVPVVWGGRFYVFWVTFREEPEIQASASTDFTVSTDKISIPASHATKIVKAQLHWTERLQGRWSPDEGGSNEVEMISKSISQHIPFDSGKIPVYPIFVGSGLKINLGGYYQDGKIFGKTFYLAGRNSIPKVQDLSEQDDDMPPSLPYGFESSHYYDFFQPDKDYSPNDNPLFYVFYNATHTTDSQRWKRVKVHIFAPGNNFTFVALNNEVDVPGFSQETIKLTEPIFYQNDTDTFFIEPILNETQSIEQVTKWVIDKPSLPPARVPIDRLPIIPAYPRPQLSPFSPKDPSPITNLGNLVFSSPLGSTGLVIRQTSDWLTKSQVSLVKSNQLAGEFSAASKLSSQLSAGQLFVRNNIGVKP